MSGGAPWIHGRNRLENNTVTSSGGGYGLYVTSTSQFDVTDNNTFKNNGVAGIYLGANANVRIGEDNTIAYNDYGVYMSTSYAPEVRDNNTIHNNSVAGIFISSSVGTFNRQIWWNDIVDNGKGIEAQDPPSGNYFHAECNWWKHDQGPYDPIRPEEGGPPDYNNNTAGEPVSDYFHYRADPYGGQYWYLDLPAAQDTSCSA